MHRAFNLENLVRFQGGLPLRRSTSIRTDAPIFLTWGEHRTGRRAGRDSAVRCREERRRAALPRTGLWIDPRALHHLEVQADRRRQRFRKPPSDEPWRSAPALAFLACSPSSLHQFLLENLDDQRRRLVANQWSRTSRDQQVQPPRVSFLPPLRAVNVLTEIRLCAASAVLALRSPPSAPSRPATVFASSRPRDPRWARTPRGLGRSRSFSTDVADWVGAGFQNQSRWVRFLSSVPSTRCPTATMPRRLKIRVLSAASSHPSPTTPEES